MNRETLEQFNQVNRPPMDKMVDAENYNTANVIGLPPRTPNYGKTPKYLQKYKDEAAVKQEIKNEREAAKLRPPGTVVMPE